MTRAGPLPAVDGRGAAEINRTIATRRLVALAAALDKAEDGMTAGEILRALADAGVAVENPTYPNSLRQFGYIEVRGPRGPRQRWYPTPLLRKRVEPEVDAS